MRPSERAAAVRFFVETGLREHARAVLDAFASGASASTSGETARALSAAVGRAAVTDEVLLMRITEDRIQHFHHSRALAAAAERRDEMRRASTSPADVLGGS